MPDEIKSTPEQETLARVIGEAVERAVTRAMAKAAPRVEAPELLDVEAAATWLSLPVKRLNDWRSFGGGPRFVKIGKRSIRYRRQDLEAFALERRCKNTGEGDALAREAAGE